MVVVNFPSKERDVFAGLSNHFWALKYTTFQFDWLAVNEDFLQNLDVFLRFLYLGFLDCNLLYFYEKYTITYQILLNMFPDTSTKPSAEPPPTNKTREGWDDGRLEGWKDDF